VAESTEMEQIYIPRFMWFWRFPQKGKKDWRYFTKKIIKKRNMVACAGIEAGEANYTSEKLFQSSLS
jgi:hypothetical protein